MSDRLTDEERMTLKTAAFGAVFLVSNADPGLSAMVKESFAASDTIAGSSGLVREALTTGPLPSLPDDPAAIEELVLPALDRAVAILRARAPEEVDRYRATVLAAARQVADASKGVSEAESTTMATIMGALGVTE